MSHIQRAYADRIARALATRGGHLAIGRGGFTLHYDNARLSGYDGDRIKATAIDAGLPVIDSRCAPFDNVARVLVKGPMVAVNRAPDPNPWHGLSHAPLAFCAKLYRRAGAEVANVAPKPELDTAFREAPNEGVCELFDFWLHHVRMHGE